MWGPVVLAVIAKLKGDANLTSLLGGTHIYRNRTRTNIQIPGVYWSIVYEGLEENLAPVNVQWDIFTDGTTNTAAIEKRLYELMHSDVAMQYTGLLMWSQFLSRYDMHDENEGVMHTALEFKYTPARENG